MMAVVVVVKGVKNDNDNNVIRFPIDGLEVDDKNKTTELPSI